MNIVDQNLVPITQGAKASVQYCIGPYGQVRTTTGVVVEVTPVSITLKSDTSVSVPGRYFMNHVPAGHPLCIPMSTTRLADGRVRCYHRHEDYEHGHESFVRVLT